MTEGHNPWAGMQSKCVSLWALVHATHEQVSKAHGGAGSRTVCTCASDRPQGAPSLHSPPSTASSRERSRSGVPVSPRRNRGEPDPIPRHRADNSMTDRQAFVNVFFRNGLSNPWGTREKTLGTAPDCCSHATATAPPSHTATVTPPIMPTVTRHTHKTHIGAPLRMHGSHACVMPVSRADAPLFRWL